MYIFDMLSTKAVRQEERELPHPLSGTNPSNTHIYKTIFRYFVAIDYNPNVSL